MNDTAVVLQWSEANQRYLMAAIEELRPFVGPSGGTAERFDSPTPRPNPKQIASAMQLPPALEVICGLFGLSSFERAVLVVCAAVELDPEIALRTQGGKGLTFGFLLGRVKGAHWSALAPTAPLRRWRLVEIGQGSSMASSPLRIDERVLHFLTGVASIDERLLGVVRPVEPPDHLVPSHRSLAGRLVAAWTRAVPNGPHPVVQIVGADASSAKDIAAAGCRDLGLHLCAVSSESLPVDSHELTALMRLWEREAALSKSALLLECAADADGDSPRDQAVSRLVEEVGGLLVLAGRDRWPARRRPSVVVSATRPTAEEQAQLWAAALGPASDSVAAHFNMDASAIRAASAEALALCALEDAPRAAVEAAAREACRRQGRPRLDAMAQRIDSIATWSDLVLPEDHMATLRVIARQVRHRRRVYEDWGFGAKSSRGLGTSVLFEGPSGTGKTMAAEVLANELHLDLYRIDLSAVVSKYIGETEKNLRRVFDAAEDGNVVLLFDEADALFGKRSEVRDSHDRYANIEVSYLLQRMEAYQGLAILTTNMKGALDTAFLRRIRFVVHFPFPDVSQRAEIWHRVFPAATPTRGLDLPSLARLNVTGGNIRNIALNAAFLAVEAGEPVTMRHVLTAARGEYSKIERALTDAEVRGWART